MFVCAFAVRCATATSLRGDDHASLWTAAALLKGDRPFQDFFDIGTPLFWGVSALVQYLVGYRVIGELVLGSTLAAFALTLAFHLSWRATGSLALSAGLTALAIVVAAQRSLYGYPKLFLYPLALWLCWRYVDRPELRRTIVLAAGVAFAFGYRHDHGAYIGVGAAAAVLAAHWRAGPRAVGRATVRFGVLLALLLSPYLAFVQVNEGLVSYFRERIQLARNFDASSRRPASLIVNPAAPDYWLAIAPPSPSRVFVEWRPDVPRGVRMSLEEKYSLTSGIDPKKGLYEYFAADVSAANLAALAGDSRIAVIDGIGPPEVNGRSEARPDGGMVATEAAPADAPPDARARVRIQWNSTVEEGERAQLERQYRLLDSRVRWEYALTDVSRENVRSIVDDSHVYDTGLIDRDTYRIMEEPWMVRLQRAVPLFRLSIAPRYWSDENAGILLHHLSVALPYLLLAMLIGNWLRGRRSGQMAFAPEKLFVAAVMMAVAHQALLRRTGYFADHAAMAAVLGACALGHVSWSSHVPRWPPVRWVPRAIAWALLGGAAVAGAVYGHFGTAVALADIRGAGIVWEDNVRTLSALSASPPIDAYAPRGITGDRALIRYLYECTGPDDRVWLMSELFPFPYYTERRWFAHVYWQEGLLSSPEQQQRTIERLEREEVPVAIALGGTEPLQYLEAYPLVKEYVARRYTTHYAITEEDVERGQTFWLLADSRRQPTGTFEQLGLPCYR